MRHTAVWAFALALSLFGPSCAPAPHSRAAGAVAPFTVQPVAWSTATSSLGKVSAVADNGDVVCVFADDGANVFNAGAFVSRDEHVKGWIAGDAIYATDGSARWIVGIDGAGHVHRLRAMSTFEDVTARYGLGSKTVRGAAVVGPGRVGFLLEHEIALSDGNNVAILPSSTIAAFAGGGGFGAGVTKDGIELVNATNGLVTRFALPGAEWVTLDSRGRLYAATRRGVYAADGSGALSLVFDAGHDGIHGLVASAERVWFADRGELGVIDGDRVAETTGASIATDAKLQASPSGDVWVISGGKLARFTPVGAHSSSTPTWARTIAPVFARSCAACHQPDGVSGTDLSTEAAWTGKRGLIRERVLSRTMPPQGHPLSDADRAAITGWLDGGPRTTSP